MTLKDRILLIASTLMDGKATPDEQGVLSRALEYVAQDVDRQTLDLRRANAHLDALYQAGREAAVGTVERLRPVLVLHRGGRV